MEENISNATLQFQSICFSSFLLPTLWTLFVDLPKLYVYHQFVIA